MPFVLKAASLALLKFPMLNAHVDDDCTVSHAHPPTLPSHTAPHCAVPRRAVLERAVRWRAVTCVAVVCGALPGHVDAGAHYDAHALLRVDGWPRGQGRAGRGRARCSMERRGAARPGLVSRVAAPHSRPLACASAAFVQAVTHKASHNLSLAMQTPQGLLVPNVKDCQVRQLNTLPHHAPASFLPFSCMP